MNNKYYLRDSFTTQEKIDRISSSKITVGVDGFDRTLRQFGLEPSDYSGISKSNFFARMEEDLEDRYEEFVDSLFQDEGYKGDKFNLQLIGLPPERDYQGIGDTVIGFEGSRLDEVIDGISNVLYLDQVDQSVDFPSLGFRTSETRAEIEPSEDLPIIIRDSEGNISAEYGEGYNVEAPIRSNIEARVYPSSNIVAISNSSIRSGVQSDISHFIIDQAEQDESTSVERSSDER